MNNKDFFRALGEVDDDLIKEASSKRLHKKAIIKWSSFAAAFLIVAAAALTVTLNMPKVATTGTVSVQNKRNIKVTAYVNSNSSQAITADTVSLLESKEIELDDVIHLPSYSLLTSNVPGFPFTFDPNGDKIELSTDNGTLSFWDQETGKVTKLGKDCVLTEKKTVYWSPLENEANKSAAVKDAKITVKTVALNGSDDGNYKLRISSDNSLYSVTFKED